MSAIVLDCSVTMAWCFEDECDEYADAVLDALADSRALVPGLWALEVANVLLAAERRKRLTPGDSARFIDLLGALPIEVDDYTHERALDATLAAGRAHGLSAYDAAYLKLAMRSGSPLATRDRDLRAASERSGVALFSLS